jgi:uncharacterized membrane protein
MAARSRALMDVAGWEAFVHGVFAIAITLLVLDIRVPPVESTPDGAALVSALLADGPRYLAYVLSFMYVGAYWITTHRSLRMLRGVDHTFLVIGLVFLMFIAIIPFVAALLAEYIGKDQQRSEVAVITFIGWQLALSVLANLELQYADRRNLMRPDVDRRALVLFERIALLAPVIWLVAMAAAVLVGTPALILPLLLLVVFLFEVPGTEQAEPDGEAAA